MWYPIHACQSWEGSTSNPCHPLNSRQRNRELAKQKNSRADQDNLVSCALDELPANSSRFLLKSISKEFRLASYGGIERREDLLVKRINREGVSLVILFEAKSFPSLLGWF